MQAAPLRPVPLVAGMGNRLNPKPSAAETAAISKESEPLIFTKSQVKSRRSQDRLRVMSERKSYFPTLCVNTTVDRRLTY